MSDTAQEQPITAEVPAVKPDEPVSQTLTNPVAKSKHLQAAIEKAEAKQAPPDEDTPDAQEAEAEAAPEAEGQGDVLEAAEPAPPADEPSDPKLEKSWDAVQRKDKMHRQAMKELKEEREKFKAEREEWAAEREKRQALKTERPLDFLEQEGIEFTDLVDRQLSEDGEPGLKTLLKRQQAELEALKAEIAESKKGREKRTQEKQIAEWKGGIKNDIDAHIDANKELGYIRQWSKVSQTDLTEMAASAIALHHQETGEILDTDTVMELIAEHVQPLWAHVSPAEDTKPAEPTEAKPKAKKAKPTLTNAAAQDVHLPKPLPRGKAARQKALAEMPWNFVKDD